MSLTAHASLSMHITPNRCWLSNNQIILPICGYTYGTIEIESNHCYIEWHDIFATNIFNKENMYL